ncbi:MAG: HEAT repeat domain-containing protein [Planctomycetes bacterium]|nr:HEAT repeat domain-containing protein [Planctomycetota bacterium]
MNAFSSLGHRAAGAVLFLSTLITMVPAQDVAADVSTLLRLKDDAEVELVTRIAATKSREGAEGLIKAYDACGSILMRREIVRALGRFDGSGEAEQPALTKITSVAASAEESELREAAIYALADSKNLGKHFLRQLVDSKASDLVREPALREHVAKATADDCEWYRFIWNLKQEQRKDDKGDIQSAELPTIRLLAFQGLTQYLSEGELVEALRREMDPKIRRLALSTMRDRDMPKAGEMAEWMLERVDFPGADRCLAARIYADRMGDKAVQTFLALAKKRDVTQEDLRQEMAQLIAAMDSDAVRKKVVKMIGKGKPHERVFALIAAGKQVDAKKLLKELGAKEIEVRRAAARIVAARELRELLPDLRKMLEKGRNPGDKQIAIEAISGLEKGSDSWLDELAVFAEDPDRDVRNAAVEQIGVGRWKKQIDVLGKALDHEDWSTRFAAVDALAEMRNKKVVPLLIERLPKDPGRLGKRIAEILWQMTAQPFEQDYPRWRGWWQEAGATFDLVSETELAKAGKAREQKRLTERTRAPAKFFGLEIESHRVIFVIDVSGSMLEAMYGREYDGRPAARIDVARQEVIGAIERLDSHALFNVYAFSSGVEKWKDESAGTNNEASRKAAITWVERLGANGGTNIYDSLEIAFQDKDVDTIYLMSDGEPTVGAVIDPHRIREDVAFWNKHRKIKIHTVAVGGSLEILEWLAEDSGGKHIKMR